jgi:hypothetical protein
MEVIELHKCKRCGKAWFPRKPGTSRDIPKKENKAHANS